MKVKYPPQFGKAILITGVISVIIGLGILLQACNKMETTKEREIMEVTRTNSIPNVAIPPIDRFAPVKTETATFALG